MRGADGVPIVPVTREARLAMDRTTSVAPLTPIFAVEVIDTEGFAWLYGPVHLHEALKISAYFEAEAQPGREPRITVPSTLVRSGSDED